TTPVCPIYRTRSNRGPPISTPTVPVLRHIRDAGLRLPHDTAGHRGCEPGRTAHRLASPTRPTVPTPQHLPTDGARPATPGHVLPHLPHHRPGEPAGRHIATFQTSDQRGPAWASATQADQEADGCGLDHGTARGRASCTPSAASSALPAGSVLPAG